MAVLRCRSNQNGHDGAGALTSTLHPSNQPPPLPLRCQRERPHLRSQPHSFRNRPPPRLQLLLGWWGSAKPSRAISPSCGTRKSQLASAREPTRHDIASPQAQQDIRQKKPRLRPRQDIFGPSTHEQMTHNIASSQAVRQDIRQKKLPSPLSPAMHLSAPKNTPGAAACCRASGLVDGSWQ